MQAELDLMTFRCLGRLRQVDAASVQLAALRSEDFGDVQGGYRAVQLLLLPNLSRDLPRQRLELGGLLLGAALELCLARGNHRLVVLNLPDVFLIRGHRDLARE